MEKEMKKSATLIALAFLTAGTIYSVEESTPKAAFKSEDAYLTKGGGTVKIVEEIADQSADIVAPVNEIKYDKHVYGKLYDIPEGYQKWLAEILYPLTVVNNTDFDVSLSFYGADYYMWLQRQDVLYFRDKDQLTLQLLNISPKTTKSLYIRFYDWWKRFYETSYDVGATWNYYIIFVPGKAVASYTAPANLFYCHWDHKERVAKLKTYNFNDSFQAGNNTFTTTFKATDKNYCITFDQSKVSQ